MTLRSNLFLRWRQLLFLQAWLAIWVAGAAEPPAELLPVALNVGFIRTCFLNVNQADAEGAFKVLAEDVGRKHGYRVTTRTQIFETAGEIQAAIKTGSVNLAIVDSWKFLAMDLGRDMKPCFVTSEQGKIGKQYVVLTRRAGGMNALADLRGKEILQLEVANSNAGHAWLETLLLENHFGTQTNFFDKVTLVSKSALAVLPVFFGKKTACLVDQFSFNLMGELNPQVANELQAVATSEPFVDNVVCLSGAGWASEKIHRDIVDALADLHNEPAGQQILTLFKVGRMIPFQEEQLATVKKLRAKFAQLQTGSARQQSEEEIKK